MSSLSNAIDALQEEIDGFNQGTSNQPKDNSTEWFLLRAKVVGHNYLRRIEQLGIENDAGACERIYKTGAKLFKTVEVPPAESILVEKLPDGTLPSGRI